MPYDDLNLGQRHQGAVNKQPANTEGYRGLEYSYIQSLWLSFYSF